MALVRSLPDASPEAGPRRSRWKLALGPALALILVLVEPGGDPLVARMAAVAVWMACWWVTEAVPIPVTALLPLVLLPLLGIESIRNVAPEYGRSTVFLFLGGFLLALGLQSSGVHRRIALFLVSKVGSAPQRMVLGFMLASAFLSMWISNTATVMVLLPIALAVLAAVRDRDVDAKTVRTLGVMVMLGIAYAADIGGMATLVGTPPNLSYKQQLTRIFPDAPEPSFAQWMMLGLPLATAFLGIGWILLTRVCFRCVRTPLLGGRDAITSLRRELGPIRRDEWIAAGIFAATALLWMTRTDIALGSWTLPGWGGLPFLTAGHLDDAVVAVAAAILLFLVPSQSEPGRHLLEWDDARDVPWGMLLLFGGGFALAAGFRSSGLSDAVGTLFESLAGTSPLLVMVCVCVGLTFLTELTSNTATTEMVLPILAAAATTLGTDPRYLMIPATLSASCAFMMPVASPTQAIVFGSGYVPIRDMVRAGIWFNLLGILLVTVFFALLAGPVMGIDPSLVPEWAR
jgi:sodium-dependent dicarboxylate transporter 2/3/5